MEFGIFNEPLDEKYIVLYVPVSVISVPVTVKFDVSLITILFLLELDIKLYVPPLIITFDEFVAVMKLPLLLVPVTLFNVNVLLPEVSIPSP